MRRTKNRSESRQELEASRERYFALFDTAPVGYLTIIGQGDILEANLTAASLLGVSRTILITTSFTTYIHPEDRDLFCLQCRQLSELLLSQQWEMRMMRRDGSFFWAELKATPTRNGEFWIVFEDINRRKQAESLMYHQSRQMIHLILDNIPQRIFWKDRDSVYQGCNGCFAEDSGLASSQEVIGKTDFDLSWHERADHYRKDDQLVMKADRPKLHYEETIKCADGKVLCITTSKVPLHDPRGNVIGVLCTYENITDRKRAEDELLDRTLFLDTLLDAIPVPIFFKDRNARYLGFNKAYEDFYGKTREELIGKSVFDIAPKDLAEIYHAKDIDLFTKAGLQVYEAQVRNALNVDRTVIFHKAAFRGQDGEVNGLIGAILDITEQHEAEEKLRQAKVAAESASQAKTAFLATMSHEIRTPLSALLGSIELLATTSLVSQQQEYLNDCQTSSKMLLNVINDVLDFSKIEAGKLELVNESFSISSMARQLIRMFSVGAGQKGLDLTLSLSDDLPRQISSDQYRLSQIISNLLSNAIKFTNSGTISLKVASEQAVPGQKPDLLFLKISVCDTGIGIPPEKQALVFDSFSQIENFSTRRHAGTGLGLAICRRLVEVMGGTVTLTSALGEGSVFTVVLPVMVSPTVIHHEANKYSETQYGTSWNILLADDEELGRSVTKALLQRRGHRVIEVANGSELLEQLRKQRFDIVLSDISMPDMDGLEVARIIRSGSVSGIDPLIPVVAMTAHAFQNDVESFQAAGFSCYASKPVNFESLLNSIDRLCSCRSHEL